MMTPVRAFAQVYGLADVGIIVYVRAVANINRIVNFRFACREKTVNLGKRPDRGQHFDGDEFA